MGKYYENGFPFISTKIDYTIIFNNLVYFFLQFFHIFSSFFFFFLNILTPSLNIIRLQTEIMFYLGEINL